jgi:hypothetical protein
MRLIGLVVVLAFGLLEHSAVKTQKTLKLHGEALNVLPGAGAVTLPESLTLRSKTASRRSARSGEVRRRAI